MNHVRRLRQLEEENRKLKQLLAKATLNDQALEELPPKNWCRLRRGVVAVGQGRTGAKPAACLRLVGMHRSVARRECRMPDSRELLSRLKELASERKRYGYRRLTVLLQREGFLGRKD